MTDVAVIGYGPAGAAAAIAAHDAGASVTVYEKTSAGGGNALYAGGFLWDAPNAADHIDSLSFGRTPRDVVEAYAAGLGELDDWLSSLGAAIEPFNPPPGGRLPAAFPSWPSFPAGDGIRYKVVSGGEGRRGEALWRVLDAAVCQRGIRIEFDSAITELPHGVPVVLACGGFEGDPVLADAYLPLGPTWPVGHAANTGDGLRMAHAAGAALWHMYGFFGWFAFRTPEFPAPFAIDFFDPGFILVDADGRRFADETAYEVHDRLRALLTYLPDNPNRPHLPTYAIFDERARLAGPLNGLLGTPNDYVWSGDNSAEIERGWIRRADDVGLPELEATLRDYTGRTVFRPLEGELYAIETWPGVAGTTGGPRHDARARVLRPDGTPVDGLYAAGAVSMVWGHLIDHGGGLTDALVFGRIAGREAAA